MVKFDRIELEAFKEPAPMVRQRSGEIALTREMGRIDNIDTDDAARQREEFRLRPKID